MQRLSRLVSPEKMHQQLHFTATCCNIPLPTTLVNQVPPNTLVNNLVNQVPTNILVNNPVTPHVQLQPAAIRIMQFNCNSIGNKIDEIFRYMENKDILLAAIQETKLTTRSKLTSNGRFSIARHNRGTN